MRGVLGHDYCAIFVVEIEVVLLLEYLQEIKLELEGPIEVLYKVGE